MRPGNPFSPSPSYFGSPSNACVFVMFTADDDNMEEIDLDNVIGRRTRGKVIDFAKAAEENPADEDDDEDDDDFQAEGEVEDDKMDED